MTRAAHHDDVFRGLRWGAILLVALSVVVVCYRLTHEAPPPPPAPVASTPGPPPTDEPIVAPVSSPAIEKPDSTPVPSPPPVRKKGALSVTPHPVVTAGSVLTAQESAPADDHQDVSSAQIAKEQSAGSPQESQASEMQPAQPNTAVGSAPAVGDNKSSALDSHAKRALKAVGRFLHIGEKKPESQAVRPPD